jgi:DNA polymerase III epsilon subunit-like protein
MTWWQQRMLGFDLETTGPLPEEARIVTAALVEVGGGEPTVTRTWLADPGVPIPEEATAVHGVSTEQAQADGRPVVDVVAEVLEHLRQFVKVGLPVVIFNARYDLTVLDRECRRLGLDPLRPELLLVVDPSVIDKWLWRFRKSLLWGEDGPSSRRLDGMCRVYDAELDVAHDAAFDALAACRLAYRMGQRGEVVRRVRNGQDGRELAALKREWDQVRMSLPQLHAAQMRWALEERRRFAEYKRRHAGELYDAGDAAGAEAELVEAGRIRAERGWPVLEPMPHENLETDPGT